MPGSEIRVLPNIPELELEVLGLMVFEGSKRVEEALDIFGETNPFYTTDNRRLYEVLSKMYSKDETIDLMTVSIRCVEKEHLHWSAYELTKITNGIVTGASFVSHCFILQEKLIARSLIESLSTAIHRAYSDDVFDALQFSEDEILKLITGNINNDYTSSFALSNKTVENILLQADRNETLGSFITGVPSGYDALDRITGGWQKSDLIIIASPPGLGKTAFMLNLALNTAKKNIPVGIISIEMSSDQLMKRLISIESGIPLAVLKSANITPSQKELMVESGKRIANMPIYIDDSSSQTVFSVRNKARKMQSKHFIEALFLDYVQIMEGKQNQNREREVAAFSSGLKKTAKVLNIPVIALSQLNEQGEVRESKAIENDANVLMKLWREDYKKGNNEISAELKNKTVLKIVKNRDGEANINLPFISELWKQTFYDASMHWSNIPVPISTQPFTPDPNARIETQYQKPFDNTDLPF